MSVRKYRGVRIVAVKYLDAIDIGKREDSPVKPLFKQGYSPIGLNYPMSLEECQKSIDNLIAKVMKTCDVDEARAVELLNEVPN